MNRVCTRLPIFSSFIWYSDHQHWRMPRHGKLGQCSFSLCPWVLHWGCRPRKCRAKECILVEGTVLFVALWIPGGDPTSTKYVECFKGGHGSCPQECRKGGQGLIVGGATPLFAKNYYTMMFSLISLPGQFTIATPPPLFKSWIHPWRGRAGGQGNAELIIKASLK